MEIDKEQTNWKLTENDNSYLHVVWLREKEIVNVQA
jgi:hypothetical protein